MTLVLIPNKNKTIITDSKLEKKYKQAQQLYSCYTLKPAFRGGAIEKLRHALTLGEGQDRRRSAQRDRLTGEGRGREVHLCVRTHALAVVTKRMIYIK